MVSTLNTQSLNPLLLGVTRQYLSVRTEYKIPHAHTDSLSLSLTLPTVSLSLFSKRHKITYPSQGQGGFYNELQWVDSLILHFCPCAAGSCWLRVSCVNWRLSGVVMAPPVRLARAGWVTSKGGDRSAEVVTF